MTHYQADGIVIVDKPAGMTSHDVVDVARKLFQSKRVGHTGTLDPDATGVLVLCLGQATRLAEYLSAARKHYVSEIVFGVETDTQDASGQILVERDAAHLTAEAIRLLLPRFQGTIEQVPPMVSARHHQGKRLYALAREGVEVERTAREVQIDLLELRDFTPGPHPSATIEVTCSTGTYIRTLAADMGAAAGVGGMMRTLRRTWVGEVQSAFTLADAHTLEELRERAAAGTLQDVVLASAVALGGWPHAHLDEAQTARIRHGQSVALDELKEQDLWGRSSVVGATPVAVIDPQGAVCAVARVAAGQLQPVKVLTRNEPV